MPDERLERARWMSQEFATYGQTGVGTGNGVFAVKRKGQVLRMIASDDSGGEGWEHVSVSLADRCPTWDEMCFVKDLFFLPEESVMQLHPPESDYVNNHPYCLHLWRPTTAAIPLPPAIYVGVKSAGTLTSEVEARAVRETAISSMSK